jgi:hypothetical protein
MSLEFCLEYSIDSFTNSSLLIKDTLIDPNQICATNFKTLKPHTNSVSGVHIAWPCVPVFYTVMLNSRPPIKHLKGVSACLVRLNSRWSLANQPESHGSDVRVEAFILQHNTAHTTASPHQRAAELMIGKTFCPVGRSARPGVELKTVAKGCSIEIRKRHASLES